VSQTIGINVRWVETNRFSPAGMNLDHPFAAIAVALGLQI
jgi:hypothetical protein